MRFGPEVGSLVPGYSAWQVRRVLLLVVFNSVGKRGQCQWSMSILDPVNDEMIGGKGRQQDRSIEFEMGKVQCLRQNESNLGGKMREIEDC